MTADVYASDDNLNAVRAQPRLASTATFSVTADAQPDVLLLIAVQLNLLNTTPERVAFEKLDDDVVRVDITICGCSERAANLVGRKLQQLTCVRTVAAGFNDGNAAS